MTTRGSRGPRVPSSKGPAINLTLKQGENLDDILYSIFIMTPYSPDKAMHLITLLDNIYSQSNIEAFTMTNDSPTERELQITQMTTLKNDLRALLVSIGSNVPSESQLNALIQQLSKLRIMLTTTIDDEKIRGQFEAAFPITINNFPLLEQVNTNTTDKHPFIFNWELLLNLLNTLPTKDNLINEIIKYLGMYPGTLSMEERYIFRDLLIQLRNNANNYGLTSSQVESLFPFVVVSPEDIVQLRQMRYRDDSLVFDLINRQRLNDAVNTIVLLGLGEGRRVIVEAKSPSDIVFNIMTPLLKRAKDHHDLEIKLLKTKPEIQSSVFKCLKCQSNNVMSVERQTRSADEPMTIFLSCMNCGNQWRIG